ncbi:hypothetical protein G6O45_29025, partial [Salmonella enterica subsp. enterica serovar Istanbul]|nr:hypothetical protein [Salmonella enterica subsp. enterica serovar Istanbul]
AYGGPKFQVTQNVMKNFTDAIGSSKVDVFPKIVMGGGSSGGNGANGSVMETLLALLLSDKLGEGSATLGGDEGNKSRTPELETMRTRIRSELLATHGNGAGIKVTTLPSATLPKG